MAFAGERFAAGCATDASVCACGAGPVPDTPVQPASSPASERPATASAIFIVPVCSFGAATTRTARIDSVAGAVLEGGDAPLAPAKASLVYESSDDAKTSVIDQPVGYWLR